MPDIIEYPDGATPLDPDELAGLKFPHVSTRGELDHLEQANIESGLLWLKRGRKGEVLDDQFVRTLHKRLFGEVWQWAGTYRRTEKNIGIDPVQIGIQLRQLLDNAQYWVENDTFAPLELAARLHHKLVFIHPFPNGNGRFSRIMADVVLHEKYGHPAIDWAGGYDLQQMNDRRNHYIQALRSADAGDYGALFTFVGHQQT